MSSDGILRHILIVEDNRDSCEILSFILKNSNNNYSVLCAHSAEQALSFMKDQLFDLYILDYRLPEMSGIELCQFIRTNDADVPIIFFSAMAFRSDREKALAAGADKYLIKPNDVMKIAENVKTLLDLKSSINKNKLETKN